VIETVTCEKDATEKGGVPSPSVETAAKHGVSGVMKGFGKGREA